MSADEQLSLPGITAPPRRNRAKPVAEINPIARVVVATRAKHLSDIYDYLVPEKLSAQATPGSLVRVRFRGALTDGFIVDRCAEPHFDGTLQTVVRVTSSTPVLSPDVLQLAQIVQQHYGGALIDVLRMAIPPRHAGGEDSGHQYAAAPAFTGSNQTPTWDQYPAGAAFLARCLANQSPHAALTYPPGFTANQQPYWAQLLTELAAAMASAERTSVFVVPDNRALEILRAALGEVFTAAQLAELSTDIGPKARYENFTRCLAGQPLVAFGTRTAVWAPLPRIGAIAVHDEGHPALTEQRAPYPAIDWVARHRAGLLQCGYVSGATVHHPRTYALGTQQLMLPVTMPAAALRHYAPRIQVLTEPDDRNPLAGVVRIDEAMVRALRTAVHTGSALVVVPTIGQYSAVWCADCAARARCGRCREPLTVVPPGRSAQCLSCGYPGGFSCTSCGSRRTRTQLRGVGHTTADIGRLIPGTTIIAATAAETTAVRPDQAGVVVVATAGAEPVIPGGYQAALVLEPHDYWARPHSDADFTAMRTFARVVSLVKAAASGGVVLLPGQDSQGLVAAVRRWQLAEQGNTLIQERIELALPPAVPAIQLVGSEAVLGQFLHELAPQKGLDVLGPVAIPDDTEETLLVRAQAKVLLRPTAPVAPTAAQISAWQEEWVQRCTGLRRRWISAGRKPPTLVALPVC